MGWWGSLTAGVRRLAEEEEMGCRWNNPGCCWREDIEVSNLKVCMGYRRGKGRREI